MGHLSPTYRIWSCAPRHSFKPDPLQKGQAIRMVCSYNIDLVLVELLLAYIPRELHGYALHKLATALPRAIHTKLA